MKNNKGLIAFLVGVIIVLVVLCILFAMNIISFNKGNTDNNDDSKIKEKLVGTYTYKGEYYDREIKTSGEGFTEYDAYALGKMTYEVLTLNADGTATMSSKNVRGSGDAGTGKWSVLGDKILINNDECTNNGNCQKVFVYSYHEFNDGIHIGSSNSNVAIVTLKK